MSRGLLGIGRARRNLDDRRAIMAYVERSIHAR